MPRTTPAAHGPMKVVREHAPLHDDPIRLVAGDRVRVGREDAEYPGWAWCSAAEGRESWVPLAILRLEGEEGVALRDYFAFELTVGVGEVVEAREELAAWVWAATAAGVEGWVPRDCLAPVRA